MVFTAAVLGASGYGGGELVRLLDEHPRFEVGFLGAHSKAGQLLRDVHPQLSGGGRVLSKLTADLDGVDVAFLALPHGASAELGHKLASNGTRVVDLGSDFRLDTAERYREAYGSDHPFPLELSQWAYGLPELFPVGEINKVASPGCYPTAALIGAAPLLEAGAISSQSIVMNALSGVSGAGRGVKEDLTYGSVSDGVRAYSVARHRHRPEIEMGLEMYSGRDDVSVTFTPHLVPMMRGELVTTTAPVAAGVTEADLRGVLLEFAESRPFVDVSDVPPQTRWVVGSNRVMVNVYLDEHAGQAVVLSALDNLTKGAAGQAIQSANLMFGLDETLGLPLAGWMP